MVDTPTLPRGMQGGAKCFSPILSHTLTAGSITRVTKHTKRRDVFHNLAHITS